MWKFHHLLRKKANNLSFFTCILDLKMKQNMFLKVKVGSKGIVHPKTETPNVVPNSVGQWK